MNGKQRKLKLSLEKGSNWWNQVLALILLYVLSTDLSKRQGQKQPASSYHYRGGLQSTKKQFIPQNK